METAEQKEAHIQTQENQGASKTSQAKHDDPDYTFLALIVNIVLTAITLAIAVAGILQAWAAKEAADIAINSQRSWIVENGVEGPEMKHDWVKNAKCHFKIIGSSPARIVESNFRFHLVGARPKNEITEPDLPPQPDYKKVYDLESVPEMGGILPPEKEFTINVTLEGMFLNPEDVEAINKWEKFACVYGFIRYKDAFSKSRVRETRFCYIYSVWRSPLGKAEHPSHFVVGGPPAYNEVT